MRIDTVGKCSLVVAVGFPVGIAGAVAAALNGPLGSNNIWLVLAWCALDTVAVASVATWWVNRRSAPETLLSQQQN